MCHFSWLPASLPATCSCPPGVSETAWGREEETSVWKQGEPFNAKKSANKFKFTVTENCDWFWKSEWKKECRLIREQMCISVRVSVCLSLWKRSAGVLLLVMKEWQKKRRWQAQLITHKQTSTEIVLNQISGTSSTNTYTHTHSQRLQRAKNWPIIR